MSGHSIQILVLCLLSMLTTACGLSEIRARQKEWDDRVAAFQRDLTDPQERSAQLTNRPKSEAISWSQINTGLKSTHPRGVFGRNEAVLLALAIDPQIPSTLYGGAEFAGAFKSTDGGMRWHEINSGLPSMPFHIGHLVVDPQVTGTVYAGTGGSGIFKSTNGGASWSLINTGIPMTKYYDDRSVYVNGTGLPTIAVGALALDPQVPSTVYAAVFGSGIFKSTNGGASWSAINTGLIVRDEAQRSGFGPDLVVALAIDPQMPTTVYAGTIHSRVFKTMNGGESWSETGLSFKDSNTVRGVNTLVIDPKVPSTVYAVTGRSGVFKSTDAGASWSAVNTGLQDSGAGYVITALAIDPQVSSTLYAGADYGVFISMNGGASWIDVNTGIPVIRLVQVVKFLVVDPQVTRTVYAGTSSINGVYKSTNAGAR